MSTAPDLSWVAWKPEDISAATEAALSAKRAAYAAIKAVPAGERTFANTIGALEHANETTTDLQQRFEFLSNVHPEEAIRSATQAAAQTMEQEHVALSFDRGLWEAITAWEAKGEQVDPLDRKLADTSLRDMRRMGFALPEAQFDRLKAISKELSMVASEFERAIADYEDHIVVTREQLVGLPANYITGLPQQPDGTYHITLDYPVMGPFMQYATNDQARQELDKKRWRKGGFENLKRLAHMIELRQEQARLLGYPTHADYVTEIRMAKNAPTVERFLAGIIEKLQPAVHAELLELVAIKKKTRNLEKPAPIHSHELAYWSNILRKEKFDLDGEEVRHHFPADHVMAGIMGIYEELLGLKFIAVPGVALWEPSVTLFEATDAATGHSFGHFTLDLYPRTGKYGHYAAFPVTLARDNPDGTRVSGLIGLVCNFPTPTAEVPSLLSHYEVEVLFHEFGHVVHALVSGGHWQSQNGFAVAMDFIEALSQIFEYWAWNPTVLARISKHYKTGAPLSSELVAKMLKAKRFMEASEFNGQANKALYDLRMHTQPTDAALSADKLGQMHRDMVLEHEHMDLPVDAIFAAGWGHMSDYDAGYYGYLWSKVYAADMFTRLAPNPLAHAVGTDYRRLVLEPGATKPEIKLVEAFLGRTSNDRAFLAELGIL